MLFQSLLGHQSGDVSAKYRAAEIRWLGPAAFEIISTECTGQGKLSKRTIAAGLSKLDGWAMAKSKLRRMFEFKDFTQAFG
jgi:hypothetical protein